MIRKNRKTERQLKRGISLLLAGMLLAGSLITVDASGLSGTDFDQNLNDAEQSIDTDTAADSGFFVEEETQDTGSAEEWETEESIEEAAGFESVESADGTDFSDFDYGSSDFEDSDFGPEEETSYVADPAADPDIRYIKGRPLTEEELAEQRSYERVSPGMEAPEEPDIGNTASGYTARAYAASFPKTYDARENGWVTSVKNQGTGNGICWAFSLAALMETSLLKQGLGTYDLSEEHLAYFLYNRENDPLGNTPNDKTTNGDGYHEGGNGFMAVTHLATWSGMTTESDVPMPSGGQALLPDSSKAYHAAAYLKNANLSGYSANSSVSVTRVKTLITGNGAAGALLKYSGDYFAYDTAAYACPSGYDTSDGKINHMVTLVGWDDTYSYKNFSEASGVTEDGAWIAKNSWGAKWGADGYFYISYKDASLCDLVSVEAMLTPSYPNNYFYDGSALNKSISLGTDESTANVFLAKAGNGKAEILGEVGVFTFCDNTQYSVRVYTNLTDPAVPTSGTLAAKVNCTQSFAGIRTWNIPEVTLLPGTYYSIVVTNTHTSAVLKLDTESDRDLGWVTSAADIQYGQSFYSAGSLSNWQDLASPGAGKDGIPVCVRIKAHTKSTDLTPSLSLTLNSAAVSAGASLTMEMGKTSTIAASVAPESKGGNLCDVTSSAPDVVAVEVTDGETAKLTGKSPGTAVITCKSRLVSGLSVSFSVTVTYQPPSALKAASARYDRILLNWTGSTSAPVSGYRIFRASSGQAERCIATVSAQTQSYLDQSLVTGMTYTYRIQAYTALSTGTTVSSPYTNEVSAVPSMEVSVCKVTAKAGPYNRITWNKIAGAKGYYVYRRLPGKKWSRIKTVKSVNTLAYKDQNVKTLTRYEYCVRAYRTVSGKTLLNKYDAVRSVIAAPSRQKIKSLTSVSKGIRVRWTPQKKASGYRIYRRTKNGKWTLLKEISKASTSSFVDKTAKKNRVYYYSVRAFIKEPDGSRVYSLYTAKQGKR